MILRRVFRSWIKKSQSMRFPEIVQRDCLAGCSILHFLHRYIHLFARWSRIIAWINVSFRVQIIFMVGIRLSEYWLFWGCLILSSWSWWMDPDCCGETFWQGLGLSREAKFTDWRIVWWTTNLPYRSLPGERIGSKFGNVHINKSLFVVSGFWNAALCIFLYDLNLQLVLRFANRFFMPLWNRDNIDNVQVRINGSLVIFIKNPPL